MPVQNAEIAAMFDQVGDSLEIGRGSISSTRAVRVIEGLPKAVESLMSAGRDLSELPGIGKIAYRGPSSC